MTRYLTAALGSLLLAGCLSPVRSDVDSLVCHRADLPVDAALPAPVTSAGPDERTSAIVQAAAQEEKGKLPELLPPQKKPGLSLTERLEVPPGVPGWETPALKMPSPDTLTPKVYDELIQKYFAKLPPIGADPAPVPGGRPLSLADLQRLARGTNPTLRQAAADVAAARGAAIQAGLYPNPIFGTTSATAGPGGGPFNGVFLSQTIKTMGKLKLNEAAATMDMLNAQLAHRRAETDVTAAVRGAYFAVLVAQEGMKANKALVQLTDEAYAVMVIQFKAGIVAPYEPAQLGALAAQARAGLVQSRNSYVLAWKQLAAALGTPAMPPTELEGRADMPIPRYDYDKALAHVLANHTDVLTAQHTIAKARYSLRLAEVTPIPDVNVQTGVQLDSSPPGPARMIGLVQMSVPVPIFDRNPGGIRQAQANLVKAVEEPHRVRSDLSGKVAEAFRRYTENRALLELYRTHVLPKQVQAYRAAVKRHDVAKPGEVAFNDLITAEQTLVTSVGTYLAVLAAQWQAVADVANYLQTDDLYALAAEMEACPAADLGALLALPCCHPCAAPPVPRIIDAPGRPALLPPAEVHRP